MVAGLVIVATLRGWWMLDRVPEAARPISALMVGSVAALATLAISGD
jgi:hypothetical protein